MKTKMVLSLGLLVGTFALVTAWLRGHTPDSPPAVAELSHVFHSAEPASASPQLASRPALTHAKLGQSAGQADTFARAETRQALQTFLQETESYVDQDQGQRLFQASPWDTTLHYQGALETLAQPYSLPLRKEDVSRRVLALHFLGLSQHTSGDDCLKLVSGLHDQFQNTESQDLRYALLWDVLAAGKICIPLAETALRDFQQQVVQSQSFKAQMDMAFAYVAEKNPTH